MIETTFDKVEGGVQGLGNYVNQKTSGVQQNIADGYNHYVVRPKTAVYNHANSGKHDIFFKKIIFIGEDE